MEKIRFERFEESKLNHAEGDRRINEGKEVVVEKEWQQFWNTAAAAVRGVQFILGVYLIIDYKKFGALCVPPSSCGGLGWPSAPSLGSKGAKPNMLNLVSK